MIRVLGGGRADARPLLSTLLIGLVLLVAAHLLGALHGPGFTASHASLPGVACSHPASVGSSHVEAAPGPGHEHQQRGNGEIEHAVDRLRAPADQAPAVAEAAESFSYEAAVSTLPSGLAERPGNSHSPPDGRSTLVLHCVWRQ
jgi:hypothetical protein